MEAREATRERNHETDKQNIINNDNNNNEEYI